MQGLGRQATEIKDQKSEELCLGEAQRHSESKGTEEFSVQPVHSPFNFRWEFAPYFLDFGKTAQVFMKVKSF